MANDVKQQINEYKKRKSVVKDDSTSQNKDK